MRNTLEDFYYGNITPGEQDMAPKSELKQATDRVVRCENQLMEQLDEAGQAVLASSSNRSTKSTASQPWKTSSWVFGWVPRS